MTEQSNCSVILTFLWIPFFGSGIMMDFVHCSCQSLSLQILWQIIVTALIISSPPFLSSPGILSTPGDFPFFMLFIASFTSSSNTWVGSGFGSDFFSSYQNLSSTLIGCWYNSLQYSDHRSNTVFESVSRFPFLSSITEVWGCLVFVNSLT